MGGMIAPCDACPAQRAFRRGNKIDEEGGRAIAFSIKDLTSLASLDLRCEHQVSFADYYYNYLR
jgi:hypothetical protein